MKKMLLLILLAGCTRVSQNDFPQPAIAALSRITISDPASYQPVRWGTPRGWTKGDSAVLLLFNSRSKIKDFTFSVKLDSMQLLGHRKLSDSTESVNTLTARLDVDRHWRDSLRHLARALPVADTTQLGYYLRHTFRYRNSQGRLALDSIDFYVDRRGKVKMAGYRAYASKIWPFVSKH
jgi:hypothetical protein